MPDATPPFSSEYVETLIQRLGEGGPVRCGEAPDFLLMQLADLEAEALQNGACDRTLSLLGRARTMAGFACLRTLQATPHGH
ncbi:hypothetical protein AEGHOMDF_4011 [Methylobacterium soli]|nr:hypothetical protein AEGHOMDF_4011 [Methylobacterium soli]